MSVFAIPLAILALFTLAGLAVLAPGRGANHAIAGLRPRDALLLAPAFGGLALAVVAWLDVSAFNGQTALVWAATAALCATGAFRAARSGVRRADATSAGALLLLLLVVAAFPFRNHVAAPGVDSQYFAFVTWMIDKGLGFPDARFWPTLEVRQRFLGTGGTEALAAMTWRLGSGDASFAHLHLSIAFVVAALLAAWVTIRRLAPDLPRAIALPCLFFAANSAFIWQYGDGSVARVPAIAGLLLIAGLLAGARTKPGEPVRWALPILIGLVHGAMLAVHYRYFIWTTIALALWLAIETWRRRGERGVLRLWVVPVASAAVVLPVLAGILWNVDLLTARGDPSSAGTIGVMREQTAVELIFDFARFQGLVAHGLVALGIVLAWRKRAWGPTESFGLATWVGVGVFLFDPLIQFVAPFTRSMFYPSMAAISDFSVPKLVFGTICSVAMWCALQRVSARAARGMSLAGVVAVVCIGVLAWFGILPLYNLQNQVVVDLSFVYVIADFPGPFGTEFIYATVLLATAGCVFVAGMARSGAAAANALTVGLLVLFGAYEVANSRFNRAELTPAQRVAYEWIRDNTDFATTLVLAASHRDIDPLVEDENVAGVIPEGRPYDWSLPWLAIIADRGAVFTRANSVARFTAAFPVMAGELPPLAALDRAYWHPADAESVELMRRWGITHVYVPDRYQPFLAEALARSPALVEVFATPSDNWPDRANVIYRLAAAP
jgi:hypothetical protein